MKSYFIYVFLTLLAIASIGNAQKIPVSNLENTRSEIQQKAIYLNENWKRISDSSQASFKRITLLKDNNNLLPMGACGKKNWELYGYRDSSSKYTLLNGEYYWFDSKKRLSSVHSFKDGKYKYCKEYYKNGELKQFFNYESDSLNSLWSVTLYSKKGKIKTMYLMKSDEHGKWPKTRD
ncbi:MAG: hypothetical protein IPM51_07605 [Sphingobacteriaceae bacterium]|nr:hypothetical protein [Sphingobacteriaceae bacterium]